MLTLLHLVIWLQLKVVLTSIALDYGGFHNLSVTSSDLIYAACLINGDPGTLTPGSGFSMRYTAHIVGGISYGIAAEDITQHSSSVAPGFGFTNSIGCGVNAVAFKAALYTATLSGPSSGGLRVSAQFTISLNVPARSGGQVIGLASTQGGDVFKATLSGSECSGITIPSGVHEWNILAYSQFGHWKPQYYVHGVWSCAGVPVWRVEFCLYSGLSSWPVFS